MKILANQLAWSYYPIYPAIIDLIHLALKSVNLQKSHKFLFLLLVKAIGSDREVSAEMFRCQRAARQTMEELDAIAARLYGLSGNEMEIINGRNTH